MAGSPGIPAIRGDGAGGGCQKVNTRTKREAERTESERKTDQVGGTEWDPGTPSPHGVGPGPARRGQADRALQRPGALLSPGRGR